MTLLEFEKILKQGESIHTEFKSWIKVSNMRERIALVVDVMDEEVGVLKKLYKFDKNNIRMWC